ncbi:hypothetical protein ACK8QS_22985 (plasmid) [Ectopseudomonas mendocina]
MSTRPDRKSPFRHALRLKQPCANCPFRKSGGIELREGRMQGIVDDLLQDDHNTFHCHKTVHSARGGDWDDEHEHYTPSGHEAMCAGAATLLMAKKRPNLIMRLAFLFGDADPSDWDEAIKLVQVPGEEQTEATASTDAATAAKKERTC